MNDHAMKRGERWCEMIEVAEAYERLARHLEQKVAK